MITFTTLWSQFKSLPLVPQAILFALGIALVYATFGTLRDIFEPITRAVFGLLSEAGMTVIVALVAGALYYWLNL